MIGNKVSRRNDRGTLAGIRKRIRVIGIMTDDIEVAIPEPDVPSGVLMDKGSSMVEVNKAEAETESESIATKMVDNYYWFLVAQAPICSATLLAAQNTATRVAMLSLSILPTLLTWVLLRRKL